MSVSDTTARPRRMARGTAFRAALATSALLVACRTTGGMDDALSYRDIKPAQHPTLAASPKCRDAELLLETFHAGGMKGVTTSTGHVDAVLAKCPLAWEAHEVAGLVARLRGNDDDAWRHFMFAAADLRAKDTRFFLAEMAEQDTPVSLARAEIEFLEDVIHAHPDAAVRADALTRSLDLRKHFADLDPNATTAIGALAAWRVVGAFDNDQGKGFLATYPPEDGVDLDAEMQGSVVPVRWRLVTALTYDGAVPLDDIVSPSSGSVAYLVTWLHSDVARKARLVISTSAPFRVFLNGRVVGEEQKVDALGPDAFSVPVELTAGANQLLVKSANEDGWWRFRARLADDRGAPLSDITATNVAAPFARDKRAASPHVDIAPLSAHAGARQSFIEARTFARAGLVREALEAARRYADASKGGELSVLLVSQLLKRNQEGGKAIDLLNRSIGEGSASTVPAAFLLERARFYVSKKRYDSAQEDLRAILKNDPNTRRALHALAGVYDARSWSIDRCTLLDEGLKRWPDSGWLMRDKADCLRNRNRRVEARAMYLRAVALEPGFGLYDLANMALDAGRVDEAAEWFTRIAAQDPTAPGPLISQANVARIAGDPDRARTLLDEARAINPDYSLAYERTGDLAYDDGDKRAALALWREALTRDPRDSDLAVHIEFVADEGLGSLAKYAPTKATIAAAIKAAALKPAAAGSNVVAILDHEVVDVNSDGSSRALVTEVLQAANQRGRDGLIATSVPRGETRILDAHSITPSGEMQEASSITSGTIRFRALDVGSITVVQYLVHRPPNRLLPNHFAESWRFSGLQRDERDGTWIVILPKERAVKRTIQGDITETVEDIGDKRVRTWRALDVPPLIGEPNMPPLTDVNRRVNLSTVTDWNEYVRWEQALLKDAFRSNPEIVGLAKKLVDGAETPQQKVDRLFAYVAKEIRYTQEYETSIAGMKPHACPVILERGYGDCKDKAVLYILLLRQAGIDADYVLLMTHDEGSVDKEVPNHQFNHAIVFVRKQPGIAEGYFSDPTTDALDIGNLRSDDQGATSLVLEPEGTTWRFEPIPYQAPTFESGTVTARLDAEKHTARVDMTVRGAAASASRRAVRDAETEKKVFQNLGAWLWPGSTLIAGKSDTSEDLTKPFTLGFDMDVATALHDDADGQRIDLPHGSPFAGFTTLAERKLPLRTGIHTTQTLDVTVTVPAGRKVLRAPADYHVVHPCFTADRTTTNSAGAVRMVATYTLTCGEIAPADYPAFRTQALQVVSRERDPVVLSK